MSNLNLIDSLEIVSTKTKQYIDENLAKKADISYVDNEIANIEIITSNDIDSIITDIDN